MSVSETCRNFVRLVSANSWRDAVVHLNGLNMSETLRALKALDDADNRELRAALAALGGAVNGPRIEYARTVVETNVVPKTAPGDLAATGQVSDAQHFVRRPRSILVEPVPLSEITGYNTGVMAAGNTLMQSLLGNPRTSYNTQCQPVELATLRRRVITTNVGPFQATGLNSALTSLQTVMRAIQRDQRLVYRALGSAGMLCARHVRGSTTNISNHSWGTAVDLNIAHELDTRGDRSVQFGLQLIAPLFNAEGWYWGAGFPTEDAMHFEGGQILVTEWSRL